MALSGQRFVVGALAALSVLTCGVSTAEADVYSCTFTSSTGSISPDDFANDDGIESIENDLANGLDDQDTGLFNFDTINFPAGDAVCLYVDSDLSGNGDTGVYEARFSSRGAYVNDICLTMRFFDTVDSRLTRIELSPTEELVGDDLTDAEYVMNFTAGTGYVDFEDGDNADGAEQNENDVEPDGVVNALPLTPEEGACLLDDVTQVQLTGAFTMVLSPPILSQPAG